MPSHLDEILQAAVARGIISAEQQAALRALDAEAPVATSVREVPRGFNWVTIAYGLGALLVVFACGWFLADRWLGLGATGVLVVILVYGAIAAAATAWLDRAEFREAAGIAALIGVSLTPVAVWALESMTGLWPVETWGQPYYPAYRAAEASRWVVAELSTILVALLVLRRRRYVAVVFPIAAALAGLVLHGPALTGIPWSGILERWTLMTGAVALCAVANTTDRLTRREAGDVAFPLWTGGLLMLSAAFVAFWPTAGVLRHTIPLLAVSAIMASLTMRRRTHLVFGVAWLFLYLIYLAADVFRDTGYFPLVLAALGGLLLFATVWLQRQFPRLARRLGATGAKGGGLPGSIVTPWLVAGLALGLTLLSLPDAAEERMDREFRQRLEILRGHTGSRRSPPLRRPVPEQAQPPRGG